MPEYSYDRDRIETLRTAAVRPDINYSEFYDYFNAAFTEKRGQPSFAMRFAESLVHAYDNWTVSIEPGELIVGRPAHREHSDAEKERFARGNAAAAFCHCGVGQDSHMAIDYVRLLTLGTVGIRRLIGEYDAKLPPMEEDPESVKKHDFYAACLTALDGLDILARHYSELAASLAERETDEKQAAEYRTIAEICAKVPMYPAETFREAVQSAAFVSYALSVKPLRPSYLQFQLGRPDRYLLPYYEKDIACGRLDDYTAQTLIDCMCIQINRRVPCGLSSGYMVGGRYSDGSVVSNPLTRMFMRAVEQVHLVYPSVGLCKCSETPDEDVELALSIVSKGHSHPAIFNDDTIQRGLKYYGLDDDSACEYIHSTCVEITPVGCSNVWVASPYTNLPAELMSVLDDDTPSFDALKEKYFAHLKNVIARNCRDQIQARYERAKYCVDLLVSCFVHDCLERGTDIEEGGAKINWIMPSFVGLSNAADSLYTIRKLVFEEKKLTVAELKKALADNYESCPALLSEIRSLAKYGNDCRDDDGPDALVAEISEFIADTCENYRVPFTGNRLIPSLFCWIMHEYFGTNTGATPDGRVAHFPLGDGSGPAQGRELEGPTASILSSTSWEHYRFIGGIAVNMKFTKSVFNENSLNIMKTLVTTYLDRGGFEIQINVTDRDTLLKAKAHPEEYADLVVRVGGYSDYFVHLGPAMQNEVIERTEHCI